MVSLGPLLLHLPRTLTCLILKPVGKVSVEDLLALTTRYDLQRLVLENVCRLEASCLHTLVDTLCRKWSNLTQFSLEYCKECILGVCDTVLLEGVLNTLRHDLEVKVSVKPTTLCADKAT